MEILYSKLYDKYTKLKSKKLSDLDNLNKEQEVKFVNYMSAAEELIEHLKSEKEELLGQVNELRTELASLSATKNKEITDCQMLLVEERQKNEALSEEVGKLLKLHQDRTSDLNNKANSNSSSVRMTRKRKRQIALEKEARLISFENEGNSVETCKETASGKLLERCTKANDQSGIALLESGHDSCLIHVLFEYALGMKLSIIDQSGQMCLSVLHQSSGYSFSISWISKSPSNEDAELLYHVISLGTFERVAPEWMREDIMFSPSMCPIFFERVSQRGFTELVELSLSCTTDSKSFIKLSKGIIDSFNSIFVPHNNHNTANSPSLSSSSPDPMEAPPPSVSNDRVAYKLKGYFDLATQEIAKAVRAEEWGLVDDALLHYRNAQSILLEANSTPVPSYITPSEQQKVQSHREKISKWQSQVSERLQTLARRAGSSSANQSTTAVPLKPLGTRKNVLQKPPQRTGQVTKVGSPKSSQASGVNYDTKLVEMINTAIVDRSPSVKWEDVAGLEKAKQALMEMVILPTKRRDLFTGLRRPARGLLLFGPPGNGKTMLAKAVASESQATFFNITAASLTSKWVGEGEKLVRTLFMVAISRQPSVIFIDEIDSIMSTRLANENDASRRLKSEFLIQFDGVTSNPDDIVIVIGATNKPHELDDAVLRRLVKRIYVPLPDENVRKLLLKHRLKGQAFSLPSRDLERVVKETERYSGSDLQALCEEAAMMPIRELGADILTVKANQVRGLRYEDFKKAMATIRPSLNKSKWEELERWNEEFGSN